MCKQCTKYICTIPIQSISNQWHSNEKPIAVSLYDSIHILYMQKKFTLIHLSVYVSHFPHLKCQTASIRNIFYFSQIKWNRETKKAVIQL